MVKCYSYADGKLSEHTELQHESVIELISPTQSEISDVAQFLKIDESDINALVAGDFDNIKCKKPMFAMRINSTMNVMIILGDYMVICHDKADKSSKENKEVEQLIHAIWGTAMNQGYMNLDSQDIYDLFQGVKTAHWDSGVARGEQKIDGTLNDLSSEFWDIVSKSPRVLINITISNDICLEEIDALMTKIRQALSPQAWMIYSVSFNGESNNEIRTTIVAADSAA